MPDEREKNTAGGPDWASAWFDTVSRFTESLPPEIALQARSAQLKWWSEYCDRLMRSPGFLEMMKDSMAATSQSRKQANDFLGEMQHALQGATREDIDQLSRSLRRHQRDVSAALRDIRRRLADLSRRMRALDNGRTELHNGRTELENGRMGGEDSTPATMPAGARPAPPEGRDKPRARKKR